MAFYKCLQPFLGFKEGDNILFPMSKNNFLVKLANHKDKTVYFKGLFINQQEEERLLKEKYIRLITTKEMYKILNHMSWFVYFQEHVYLEYRHKNGFMF